MSLRELSVLEVRRKTFAFWDGINQFWITRGKGVSCDPEGSRRFRLPDFYDIRHVKVVRLSASRTGRLYPQEMFLVLIFTRGWVDPRAMVRSEGNMSLKNLVTPPGMDPGTVRLVAQRLNHCATPGPYPNLVPSLITRSGTNSSPLTILGTSTANQKKKIKFSPIIHLRHSFIPALSQNPQLPRAWLTLLNSEKFWKFLFFFSISKWQHCFEFLPVHRPQCNSAEFCLYLNFE